MTWYVPPIQGAILDRLTDHDVRVTMDDSRSVYVLQDREDLNFSDRPKREPSITFVRNVMTRIDIPITLTSGSTTFRVAVLEYGSGDRPHSRTIWGQSGSTSVYYKPKRGTTAATIAVQAQGEGAFTVGAPLVEPLPPLSELDQCIDTRNTRGVTVALTAVADHEIERAALLSFEFLDSSGCTRLPISTLSTHPMLGNYAYVDTGDSEVERENLLELEVPSGCHSIRVRGHQWKEGAPVFHDGGVDVRSYADDSFGSVVRENLERLKTLDSDRPLIVLYTTAPPVGHPTLSLRPNRLAVEYAANGALVVFLPFSRIQDEQRNPVDGVLQFNLDELDVLLEVLATRRGSNNIFIISSFPDIKAFATLNLMRALNWRTMYEVRDEMEEFNRVGYSKWFDTELERQVADRVDTIVTVSPRLASKMAVVAGSKKTPVVVPNAAPPTLIEENTGLRTAHAARIREQHRIVGYIGHLTDSWFDWDLIIKSAHDRPDLRFEIIGHGLPGSLTLPENIAYLGPRPHAEFVEISERWIAGLIPFKESPLTYAVDPNKIYEYLAVGLRTITPPMGAVESCPSTYIYHSPAQFLEQLDEAVNATFTDQEIADINRYIEGAGWDSRARTMLQLANLRDE